jgi:hypothetical protein
VCRNLTICELSVKCEVIVMKFLSLILEGDCDLCQTGEKFVVLFKYKLIFVFWKSGISDL